MAIFAQGYVIAHEVGHHVQKLLGIEPKVRQLQQNRDAGGSKAAYLCVWNSRPTVLPVSGGHSMQQQGVLESRRSGRGAKRGAGHRR